MDLFVRVIVIGLLLIGGYFAWTEFQAFQEKSIQAGNALIK